MENLKSNLGQFCKSGKVKVVAAFGAASASASAFAVDHSAAVTAAQTDGTASVTAAATAVIAIAAIMFGIGFVIKLIGR